MLEKLFLFDIDGTLTPSRSKIDSEFSFWLLEFSKQHNCSFISGGDLFESIEQLGEELLYSVQDSFHCNGNEHYKKCKLISANSWRSPRPLIKFLNDKLSRSNYPIRAGNHFEYRSGMLNYSTVGRDCTIEQRKHYAEWDRVLFERENIVQIINRRWPELTASIGGEISIDIYPNGNDKSQVLTQFKNKSIIFFGDKIHKGGNDYEIGEAISNQKLGIVYSVDDWEQTWLILKSLYSELPDR